MSATEYRADAPVHHSGRRPPPSRAEPDTGTTHLWVLGGLVVLAAVLRFATIATQSYWADEALTVYEVHLPFGSMLSAVGHAETTPPLYFILAWAWAHIFGTGEAALRSLSALAGVAVVPITYACGRELVSRRAGLIAAALAAVNPYLIWYSQEARAYMLLIALSGLSLLWCARARRDPSRRNVALWLVFSALALTAHFFAGFLVAPEAVWLLWGARTRPAVVASAALAAVQVALLPLATSDTHHGVGWIHAIHRLTRIAQVPTEFAVMTVYRHVSTAEGLIGGGLVLGGAVLLLALAGGSRERRGAVVAGALAAVVILVPLVLGLIRGADDFFVVRNLSPAWIPLAVVLGAACAVPRARDLGIAFATVLVVIFAIATIEIATSPVFQKADWRGVARALGPTTEPRAILIAGGAEANALKILVPGVSWNQPTATQRVLVDQVDIVGSISHAPLRGPGHHKGRALPRRFVNGADLLGGHWVRNFYVARFELVHPWRFDGLQMSARAGRFFRHRAPKQLLILIARGVPRSGSVRIVHPPGVHRRHGGAHHGRVHRGRVHHRRAHRHHAQRHRHHRSPF